MTDSISGHTAEVTRKTFVQLEAVRICPPGCPEAEKTGGTQGCDSRVPPAFYLGYPLYLSETEYSLVLVLLDAALDESCPSDGWTASSLLSRQLGLSGEQIAVHVLRVNHKAEEIGGRRLIASHKGLGYRLNPYM